MALNLRGIGRYVRPVMGLAAALVALAPLAAAGAPESPWSDTEFTQMRVVSATRAVGESESVTLGLHFRMDSGWKIYWRSPGDAGFPPASNWEGSQNLKSAEMSWPAPERFSVLGFETLGYKEEVVLPLRVALASPGQPLQLRGDVTFLTCDEICVPHTVPVALDLPDGPASASEAAHLINRYAVRVPGDGRGHGLALEESRVAMAGDSTTLHLTVRADSRVAEPLRAPDAFVEGPPELVFGRPTVRMTDGGGRADIAVPVDGVADLGRPLTEETLTVTMVDGERAAEWRVKADAGVLGVPAAPGTSAGGAAGEGPGLAAILVLAVLGGLILNLMPCVLPVLSIKLLSVVGHGGGDRGRVRAGFIASSAGIVAAFLVLAVSLAGFKAAGGAVGWGIQFQNPWFLIAMTAVVTLFACNLWGFFEVPLPGALARGGTGADDSLAGHFMTGVFATLLATPCSAPFLGTAVGFALSGSAADILLVFAALGLGLALPYLVVAAVPGLATRLPRPGPWMTVLRRLLGFALAATAVWLLSVLAGVAGPVAAAAVAGAMALIAAVLLIGRMARLSGRLAGGVTALLVAAALAVPAVTPAGPAVPGSPTAEGLWEPFDAAAIPSLVADGKVVVVDITADWCLTCQVNKAAVLERGDIARRLRDNGVVAMQADWTRPDPAIARYLAGFGRYGIPFNAVYGPDAPEGIVLPELLSSDTVARALDSAGPQSVAAER